MIGGIICQICFTFYSYINFTFKSCPQDNEKLFSVMCSTSQSSVNEFFFSIPDFPVGNSDYSITEKEGRKKREGRKRETSCQKV